MKNKGLLLEFTLVFFIVTGCITILSGILGSIFLSDVRFGYEAFLSPPFFGFLSALSGLITKSGKELSIRQMVFRNCLQLLSIEVMVFGVNYVYGTTFSRELSVILAIGIAFIYLLVHVILWLNDRRSAMEFNTKLAEFQKKQQGEEL